MLLKESVFEMQRFWTYMTGWHVYSVFFFNLIAQRIFFLVRELLWQSSALSIVLPHPPTRYSRERKGKLEDQNFISISTDEAKINFKKYTQVPITSKMRKVLIKWRNVHKRSSHDCFILWQLYTPQAGSQHCLCSKRLPMNQFSFDMSSLNLMELAYNMWDVVNIVILKIAPYCPLLLRILTFPDPHCRPGQIFVVQNGVYMCPTYSTTCFKFNQHLRGGF